MKGKQASQREVGYEGYGKHKGVKNAEAETQKSKESMEGYM